MSIEKTATTLACALTVAEKTAASVHDGVDGQTHKDFFVKQVSLHLSDLIEKRGGKQ